jgi:hypothetical protein
MSAHNQMRYVLICCYSAPSHIADTDILQQTQIRRFKANHAADIMLHTAGNLFLVYFLYYGK